MPIKIKKTYNYNGLNKTIKNLQSVAEEIVLIGRESFIENTKKGKDINGKAFEEYADSTVKIRSKYNKETSFRNLTFGIDSKGRSQSGGTLQSIAIKAQKLKAFTYFIDNNKGELAYYHIMGKGNLPVTKFIGWTKEARKRVNKVLKKLEFKL